MTDDGDAPRATQNLLPLHPTHVVHVRVVFGETEDPERVDHVGNVNKKIYTTCVSLRPAFVFP